MKNPRPITRARRLETRRKQLGYPDRCFYCPESDVFCLEGDHPVTEKLDSKFKRAVCRNCHRKLEARRDLAGLTKNGLYEAPESEREALGRYLLLVAEDQDSIADMLESSATCPRLAARELRSTAASLRRKAKSLSQPNHTQPGSTALEWDGIGCA